MDINKLEEDTLSINSYAFHQLQSAHNYQSIKSDFEIRNLLADNTNQNFSSNNTLMQSTASLSPTTLAKLYNHQYLFQMPLRFNSQEQQQATNLSQDDDYDEENNNNSDNESTISTTATITNQKQIPINTANTNTDTKYMLRQPPPDKASVELAKANALRTKRRTRTKFTKNQIDILEATFSKTHYPDVTVVDRLSSVLNLATERISIWFQNRRARFKKTKKVEPGRNQRRNNYLEDDDENEDEDDKENSSFRMSRCSSINSISSLSVASNAHAKLPLANPMYNPHQPLLQQENHAQIVDKISEKLRYVKDEDDEKEDDESDDETDKDPQQQPQQQIQKLNEYNPNEDNDNDDTANDEDKSSNTSSNEEVDNNLAQNLEIVTQFPKSNSTFALNDQYSDNLNGNCLLTPNSLASSRASSTSATTTNGTFMPNYYHQQTLLSLAMPPGSTTNTNLPYQIPPPFQPHFYPHPQTQPVYYTNSTEPLSPSSTSQSSYNDSTAPNLLYSQMPNMYSQTADPSATASFQNFFHQFQQQDYMTNINNPQNMYYAAAAAAYMSSCYNPTTE